MALYPIEGPYKRRIHRREFKSGGRCYVAVRFNGGRPELYRKLTDGSGLEMFVCYANRYSARKAERIAVRLMADYGSDEYPDWPVELPGGGFARIDGRPGWHHFDRCDIGG